jgi:hypothetical protein
MNGIIAKGVKADGTANTTVVPASSYYKSLYNVDEAFVYSASYVKLREVKIGYTFPSQWVKVNWFTVGNGIISRP